MTRSICNNVRFIQIVQKTEIKMLDLKLVREKPDEVEKALGRRHGDFPIAELKEVDAQHRKIQGEWESINRRSNEISEQFKTGKLSKEQMEPLRQETKEIKTRREEIEKEKQS